jgi:predicted dehydrogenase
MDGLKGGTERQMSEKVKVGVVGAGGILGAHGPALAAAGDRCVVTAVAEPDSSKHERARALLGEGVGIYADYNALLAEADVDAVDILLPHDLHMPATIAAARAGRHVLVEKVMARNIHECDRMVEACEKSGVTLTVCHDRRYDSHWIAMKKVVDSGLLGRIHFWKLDHNQDVNPAGRLRWAASRDGIGGGAIMSCLTHQIDALRWYGGEVESVSCMTHVIPERMEGESIGVIAAKMKSGALAGLAINWVTRSNDGGPNGLWYEMVHVCGDKGEAYFMTHRGTFARLHDGTDIAARLEVEGPVQAGSFAKIRADDRPGHVGCISEWLNMLMGRPHNVTTTGRDARGTVEVAEAAYISQETGRTVALPIKPTPWKSG